MVGPLATSRRQSCAMKNPPHYLVAHALDLARRLIWNEKSKRGLAMRREPISSAPFVAIGLPFFPIESAMFFMFREFAESL